MEVSLWTLVLVVGVAWFFGKRSGQQKKSSENEEGGKKSKLHRPNFVKGKVYLCQFPVSPGVKSISPFGLKLESWLAMNNIPYENVYTMEFSEKGQIPYVEFNGSQIADSNIIMEKLGEVFKVDCDAVLSDFDKAVGHSVLTMVENHTSKGGFLWRYGYHNDEFMDKMWVYFNANSFIRWVMSMTFPAWLRLKLYFHGINRHPIEVVSKMTFKDLKAISNIMQSGGVEKKRPYLFNTEKPTSFDCALFGHLAQFLYIPMDFPQKRYIEESCANLKRFADSFKEDLFPNWEDLCKEDAMRGHLGRDMEANLVKKKDQ